LQRMPSTPPEISEVMVFPSSPDGTKVGSSLFATQYWFFVPPDTQEFWIQLAGGAGKIWNPAGEVAWDAWKQDASQAKKATVPVPPEFRGKLWRVTAPGVQMGMVFDPQIPPCFSATRKKWFNPSP